MDINNMLKRERWIDLIVSIVMAIIGGVLIARPETTLNTIAMIIGGIVIAYGLYIVLRFFAKRERINDSIYTNGFVLGIMLIIFGAILFKYVGIIEALIRIIIGVWMVYNGLIRLIESNMFRDINRALWISMGITSLVIIGLGLYITFYSGALIQILGYFVLTYAVIDIVQNIIYTRNERK